jgi:hypothetical protein
MNAVTNTLLVRETLTRAAISAAEPVLQRTRPTMTWHIDSTNGRPVIRWVMLPARSSIS